MPNKYDPILGEYREDDGGGSNNNGFQYTGDSENTGTYVYIGYEHADGRWYIYRRTIASGDRLYASGASSYSANWTNRGSLSYA